MFGASTEAIATQCDIPLLDPDASRVSYGMLDIVEYRNRGGGTAVAAGEGAYNVAAHADPGLFALSVLSTEPGLKLYDPGTDAWFALEGLGGGAGGGGPDGVGVLWAGAAATEASGGRVKARNMFP